MKIKRFFAKDMTEAIAMVRQTLGEEAAILSNRRVQDGVEVVAAIEYDESMLDKSKHDQLLNPSYYAKPATTIKQSTLNPINTVNAKIKQPKATLTDLKEISAKRANLSSEKSASPFPQDPILISLRNEIASMRDMLQDELAGLIWQKKEKESPTQNMMFKKLRQLGFAAKVAKKYIKNLAHDEIGDEVFRTVLSTIANDINTTDNTLLEKGGVHVFLGPTGVGKTTTIAKLAAQFSQLHSSNDVALLTTDSYRIGAHDQLRIFAKLLDLPMRVIENEAELRSALKYFSDKKLILIDTAGMSQRDLRMQQQLQLFASKRLDLKTHIVLSATVQRMVLESAFNCFKSVNPGAVVITKVDEGFNLGALLSLILKHNLPISYVTNGQRIPEDCHVAQAHTIVSCAITMSKQYEVLIEDKQLATAFGGREIDVDV